MYNILIVDDEYVERTALRMLLEKLPMVSRVTEAENGEIAIQKVKEGTIDFVFMDIKMTKMDGLVASRVIKELKPTLKIAMLTAYADFELAQRAVKAHVDDYLLKPARPATIAASLSIIKESQQDEKEDYLVLFRRALFRGYLKESRKYFRLIFNQEHKDVIELDKVVLTIIQQASDFFGVKLDENSFKKLKTISQHGMQAKNYNELIIAIMDKIFGQIVKEKLGNYTREIDYALNYIEYYLAKGCTLRSVASYMNISPHYFSKLFKEELGENYIQYVTNRRMEIAKERIKYSKESITDIAFDLGFNEVNYFSKVFKKTEGLSPSDYRKSCVENEKKEQKLFAKNYAVVNGRWMI